MTQQSYLTCIDGDDVAHFSHPFALDLYFDINRLDQVTDNSCIIATTPNQHETLLQLRLLRGHP
jgi:hypothetical protein